MIDNGDWGRNSSFWILVKIWAWSTFKVIYLLTWALLWCFRGLYLALWTSCQWTSSPYEYVFWKLGMSLLVWYTSQIIREAWAVIYGLPFPMEFLKPSVSAYRSRQQELYLRNRTLSGAFSHRTILRNREPIHQCRKKNFFELKKN